LWFYCTRVSFDSFFGEHSINLLQLNGEGFRGYLSDCTEFECGANIYKKIEYYSIIMKNIKHKLLRLFRDGYCTPQIGRIAREINEPSSTIHYNIKKLESEGAIITYKAVFDYRKIGEGFCAFVLVALSSGELADPERIASNLAKHGEVESVDILSGDWELIVKIRTRDQEAYYQFLKNVISREMGIENTVSMVSLRQIKTEFVPLPS
jgi:Lrp/AsnC family leucine-responsive transcriptional regulator